MLDRNDYYPFGMNFVQGSEYSVVGSPLNYKYGGKELQESGFYDFGARNYMPDLGRWFGVDPLAELAPDLSPYRYAFNNPISFTDPDGMYEGDGGGDYYDDSDREPDFELPHFNTDLCSCNSISENIEKIFDGSAKVDFSFGYGGESGDGAYNDFVQDMSQENSSNEMMNDAIRDSYPENGPGPRNPRLASYYAREYNFNYESTVAMGMLQEFIFETIDFGEFSFSDLREYVVEHSNPNDSLKEQNEFYSKVVEAYKQVEGFLPDKGKLSNTQKAKVIAALSTASIVAQSENVYNKLMIKYFDSGLYDKMFGEKDNRTSFGGGGAKGDW